MMNLINRIFNNVDDRDEINKLRSRFLDHAERSRVICNNEAVDGNISLAEEIASKGELRVFSSGKKIISKNGSDNHVLFLLSGEVEVNPGSNLLITREAPKTIGEIAAMNPGQRRTADVWVRSGPVAVLELSAADFVQIAADYPSLDEELKSDLLRRYRKALKHIGCLEETFNPKYSFVEKLVLLTGPIFVALSIYLGLTEFASFPALFSVSIGGIGAVLSALFFMKQLPRYRWWRLSKMLSLTGLFGLLIPSIALKLRDENVSGSLIIEEVSQPIVVGWVLVTICSFLLAAYKDKAT